MKTYIFLADGFEDMEAVSTYDVLRRAGINAVFVGVGGNKITSANGMTVIPQISDNSVVYSEAEAFVFPGGMPGAKNLSRSKAVRQAVSFALEHDVIIAAICASPGVVLAGTGALNGKRYTCYPGFESDEGEYTASEVEEDGSLITGNGPYAAVNFAKLLVNAIKRRGKNV